MAHRAITTFVTFGLPTSNAGIGTADTLGVHQGTLLVSCPRPFQRREGAFASLSVLAQLVVLRA